MKTKKLKIASIVSLILSIIPLATLVPVFRGTTLPQNANIVWACINIISVASGLLLSIICIARKDSRSAINITSTVISGFLALLMLGIVALAFLLHLVR